MAACSPERGVCVAILITPFCAAAVRAIGRDPKSSVKKRTRVEPIDRLTVTSFIRTLMLADPSFRRYADLPGGKPRGSSGPSVDTSLGGGLILGCDCRCRDRFG